LRKRARRPTARHGDIIGPTVERRRHDGVEQLARPIADTSGAVARPFRAIDTLAAMERRGTITAGMRQAGETFRQKFATAHLDPLHAANLYRTGRGNYGNDPTIKMEAAREAVWRAICVVGGLSSAGGSCLWHVVGWERTLKEWVLEQPWNGRRMTQERGSGILVAALGVLEAHFGLRSG
jgi:hypothetical protein